MSARGGAPEPGAVEAYVALGSNLGDREGRLRAALDALGSLPGTKLCAVSRLYETEPVGGPPQGAYLNAVARLCTRLTPRAFLAHLLAIERAGGRVRREGRDAPRSLDLDLLLYGDLRVDEPGLEVPHPRLAERAFVLEPLCDLAPGLRHPVLGRTIEALALRVRDPRAVRPWSGASPAQGGSE